MKKLVYIFLVLLFMVWQPAFASCEDNCSAQQDTCMSGCSYIEDTEKQDACVRGCLRGGSSCARRCREQESSFNNDFDERFKTTMNDPVKHQMN